jgi:glycosyltransferase involved in cell wall biosynthesis
VKQVLYLSYTGMTDPLGQSQVLAYLKGLSQTGDYKFTVISFEKAEAFKRLKTDIEAFCREAGITWHPLSYTSRPPVISTFCDVRRMRKKAKEIITQQEINIVHCRSYIASIAGLDIKKKYGIPFLFDMRGFWADERIDGGIWRLSNPVYRFIYSYFKKKERQFLLHADQVVSLTQNAKDEILSWKLRSTALPITVIPCCADLKLFDPGKILPEDQQKARSELNISPGVPVISYIGSLGTWYMLNEMMAFAKMFQNRFENAVFMVLTGEPEQMVLDAALKSGLNTADLRVKKVPRNQMPVYISLSTISLFFIKPAFSKKASSPVKQGELMAMGVPVICNKAVGDTEEIVEKYKAGLVINEFSLPAYNQAIDKVYKTSFDKQQIIQGARDYFSLEKGVQLYGQVYQLMQNG